MEPVIGHTEKPGGQQKFVQENMEGIHSQSLMFTTAQILRQAQDERQGELCYIKFFLINYSDHLKHLMAKISYHFINTTL